MGFYADTAVLAVFPSAGDLTPQQLATAAADVSSVYDYAQGNPGISEADLRGWGETLGIDPDRMTTALGLLRDAGKLFQLPDPGPIMPSDGGGLGDLPTQAARVPFEHFTVPELQKAAKRAGIEVPKSATKEEVASALARGPETERGES